MEYSNYFKTRKFPGYRYYYVDTREYLADALFRGIRIRFFTEFVNDDSEFVVISCRVRRADEGAFLDAMERLKNKMLLYRHTDYPDFCMNLQDTLFRRHFGIADISEGEKAETAAAVCYIYRMPRDCAQCPFIIKEHTRGRKKSTLCIKSARQLRRDDLTGDRPPWCELMPVPEDDAGYQAYIAHLNSRGGETDG